MKILMSWIVLISCFGLAFTATVEAQVTATYLANEGFLLEAGEEKLLVDALFGEGISGYGIVPAPERRRLERGDPPYDDVDLVLATHHHGDHFESRAVAFYLEAHPESRFLSTPQAIDRLQRYLQGRGKGDALSARILGNHPLEGERTALQLGGIQVTTLRLHHGLDRRPLVENLGFIIELGGLRILHMGDSQVSLEEIRPYHLGELGIDLAFVPSWYFVYDQWLPVLDEIGARQLVAIHLAEPDAPASFFGSVGNRQQLEKRILQARPQAKIFHRVGDNQRFDRQGEAKIGEP